MKNGESVVREWGFYAVAFLILRHKHIARSLLAIGFTTAIQDTLQVRLSSPSQKIFLHGWTCYWPNGGTIWLPFLQDENDTETWDTKGNALLCAILLRKNPKIKDDLQLFIAQLIPHLLIHTKKTIRNYAAVSINLFIKEHESRRIFAENHGHKAISVACMLDQQVEFLRNLCYGIATLVVNEETVWSLANEGALKALFLLKNEQDRVSQGFVGIAVHRIIAFSRFFK